MSTRSPMSGELANRIRTIAKQISALEAGAGRGPGSSFGLPFQIGDWLWFEDGAGLCVRNTKSGVVRCLSDSHKGPTTSSSISDLREKRGDLEIEVDQSATVFDSEVASVPTFARWHAYGDRCFIEANITADAVGATPASLNALLGGYVYLPPRNMGIAMVGGDFSTTIGTAGTYSVSRSGTSISSGVVQVSGVAVIIGIVQVTVLFVLFCDPQRGGDPGLSDDPLLQIEVGDVLSFWFTYELLEGTSSYIVDGGSPPSGAILAGP